MSNVFTIKIENLELLVAAIQENTEALKANAGLHYDHTIDGRSPEVVADRGYQGGGETPKPEIKTVPVKPASTGSALDDVDEPKTSKPASTGSALDDVGSDGPELAPRNAWYQHEDGSVFAVLKDEPIPDYVEQSKKITRDQFNKIHKERKEANLENKGIEKEEPKLEDYKTEDKPAEKDPWGVDLNEPEEADVDLPSWDYTAHVIKAFAAKFGSDKVTGLMQDFNVEKLSDIKDGAMENAGKVRSQILGTLLTKNADTYHAAIANFNAGAK